MRVGAALGSEQPFQVVNHAEIILPTHVRMLWLAAGWHHAGQAADNGIPEVSASRVIELAAPENRRREKKPVISGVAIDPAGKLLAAVGDDHLVRVFDVQTGKLVHRLALHTDWVKASAFRPDGQVLATSGADRRIRFWDMRRGGRTRPRDLPGRSRPFTRWPTVPTGECWRRPASTTRCGCSTPSRDSRSASWPRRAATSARSASRPTARGWPRQAAPGWSASGTSTQRAAGGRRPGLLAAHLRLGLFARRKVLAAAGQQRIVRLLERRVGQAGGRSAASGPAKCWRSASAAPTRWPRPAAAT